MPKGVYKHPSQCGYQKGHKTFKGCEKGWFKKGQSSLIKGKTYEEIYGIEKEKEMKEKNRQIHLGKHISPITEFKKGQKSTYGFLGKHHTKEWKKETSERMKGKVPKGFILNKLIRTKTWNDKISKSKKGHIVSIKTREKISNKNKGREVSAETRRKMSSHRGATRYNYKGTTPLTEQIRKLLEYKQWRSDIFQRDNFTCQTCGLHSGYGKAIRLEAHHSEKSFNELLTEFLREYNQFSPFEDKDTLFKLAIKWKPFWNADGETLCKACHDKTKNGRKK